MSSGVDPVAATAGCSAFVHPPACARCGLRPSGAYALFFNLCADCRAGMTRTEMRVWSS